MSRIYDTIGIIWKPVGVRTAETNLRYHKLINQATTQVKILIEYSVNLLECLQGQLGLPCLEREYWK